MSEIIGVIPARFASTRLPGKPLMEIAGKSLIGRVIEGAKSSIMLNEVIVATDNQQIHEESLKYKALPIMTNSELPSGSDRIFSAISQLKVLPKFIINIQGDEIFITGDIIDTLIRFITTNNFQIATLIQKIKNPVELVNPNVVKVALANNFKAHYFSRASIPFVREKSKSLNDSHTFYKHIGIYAYKYDALKQFVTLKESINEKIEKLEQLRFLDNGLDIYCCEINAELLGIDTIEDVKAAEKILKGRSYG